MTAKVWVIVGALGVLLLAALGGYIYEKVRDRSEPDDPAYIKVLAADYDDLIARTETAEGLVKSLSTRIDGLEQSRSEIAGELANSRTEVGILKYERDKQRRLVEEARTAIREGYDTSIRIGDSNSRGIAGIQSAIDLLERLEGGDTGS